MNGNSLGIMVDLDRCVGCYACEVACRQENQATSTVSWIRLHTVGPALVDGKLRMDYIPLISKGCDFCKKRESGPSCIYHCPTKALRLCSTASMLDAMSGKKRYQICNIKSNNP